MNEEAKGLAAQLRAKAFQRRTHSTDAYTDASDIKRKYRVKGQSEGLAEAADMAEAWEARLRQVVAELRDWSSDRIKNEYEIAADMIEKALEQTQ